MSLTLKLTGEDLEGCAGELVKEVAEEMEDGKTCIYPTETCYGLGTGALSQTGMRKIYGMKMRSESKKLSCVVSSLEQAQEYCVITEDEKKLCEEFMPGPLTLVAQKKDNIPDILNTDFVFRISSDPIARELPELCGTPIVSTSANLSGAPNPYSVDDISRIIKEKADYIIDAGELSPTEPSTVVRIEDGKPVVLREGPVLEEQIRKVVGG